MHTYIHFLDITVSNPSYLCMHVYLGDVGKPRADSDRACAEIVHLVLRIELWSHYVYTNSTNYIKRTRNAAFLQSLCISQSMKSIQLKYNYQLSEQTVLFPA